jgi:8-oxo-dGTP diphosphatase
MLHTYIVNTAGVIYNNKGQFLVIRRSDKDKQFPGIFAYPAGKVSAEEAVDNILEKNLQREVKEETGVEIDKIEYLHSNLFQRTSGEWVVIICFTARYLNGDLKADDPNEVSSVSWVDPVKISQLATIPMVKKIFKLAAQKLKNK